MSGFQFSYRPYRRCIVVVVVVVAVVGCRMCWLTGSSSGATRCIQSYGNRDLSQAWRFTAHPLARQCSILYLTINLNSNNRIS
jgi:hypothetical protein